MRLPLAASRHLLSASRHVFTPCTISQPVTCYQSAVSLHHTSPPASVSLKSQSYSQPVSQSSPASKKSPFRPSYSHSSVLVRSMSLIRTHPTKPHPSSALGMHTAYDVTRSKPLITRLCNRLKFLGPCGVRGRGEGGREGEGRV